ncbi:MAG: methyltransferase domain-containing protein [Anaerolineales bacterium]|nr:methyltransferase domain-containing protein [Anaerolineales bacterium]
MLPDPNSPQFWQASYRSGQTAWDLGYPTPVFARLAASGDYPPGKMIVLGAGRGYDARLFAQHGHEVLAVDFASDAVVAMHMQNDPLHPVQVLQADMFALPEVMNGRFDYVLEYVCFCAITPSRRDDFAALAARLLRPGGLYITLAFPIGRRPGGPPFVIQPDAVIGLFAEHGFSLHHREFPPDSIPSRQKIEELLILRRA